MRNTVRMTSFLLLLACLLAWNARAATVYVSPTGDDANPGSKERPFKTLAAASRHTPAGKNTIRLEPGSYRETESCMLKPGVSIVGGGQARTALYWSVTQVLDKNPRIIAPEKFLIQVYDSADASVSGFRMEGGLEGRQRAHGGLIAHHVKNFRIHDLLARSFSYGAIYLSDAQNSSIHHCRIEDSGFPSKEACSGGIIVGDLTDSSVHDCVIRENRGAYGIKGTKLSWNYPQDDPQVYSQAHRMQVIRSKFYNNDINVRQVGGWGQGQPNMAMELWHTHAVGCEIYNNRFNECLSLTGESDEPKTVRVYHNHFILEPGYSYAIEVDQENMEIDHNYFANGYYPIAAWGGRRDGLRIHDNVFDGIEKVAVLLFTGGVKDLQFVNNTIYVRGAFPFVALGGGESENILVANNIFYKAGPASHVDVLFLDPPTKAGVRTTIKVGTLAFKNNLFFQCPPVGDGALTVDPRLTRLPQNDGSARFRVGNPELSRATWIGAGDEEATR